MVLNYQRWTPPCGCSFEQEVNSETGEVKLLFAHGVCGGHEHITNNSKKTLLAANKGPTKEEIIKKKEQAWENNRKRNLEEFDNHPTNKRIRSKTRAVLMDPDTQFLHAEYIVDRESVERHVDRFTKERRRDLLLGLQCEHALNAQEVYDHIMQHPEEQQITEE